MTKGIKAKPGGVDELAELYPGTRKLTVRIVRLEGNGASRMVSYESRVAIVYALSIQQLGRVGKAIHNAALGAEGAEDGVFEAVADVIGFDTADVSAMVSSDYEQLMAAILEMNADFFTRARVNPASEGQATTAGTNGDGVMPSSSSNLVAAPIPSGSH